MKKHRLTILASILSFWLGYSLATFLPVRPKNNNVKPKKVILHEYKMPDGATLTTSEEVINE